MVSKMLALGLLLCRWTAAESGRKVASQGCHKLIEEQCCQYKDGRSKWASNCVLTKNVKAPSRDKSNVCQPEKFVRPKEFGLGSTGFVGDVVDCPIGQEECLPLPLPVQQAHGKDYPGRIVCYRGGSACTAEKPCGPYEGDCDSDDECAGDLVCDADKIDGKLTGGSAPDICKPLGLDRCTGLQPCFFGSDACTKEKPCSAWVGDCDSDDQCAGDLVCVIAKGPQADFCQPKGTPKPRGKQPAFTKGVKECKAYEYDTGKCTACPGYWYQSCPTKTFEHYGIKMTGRGYESGQKYCGFLSCKVKCTIRSYDYGCGCNQAQPVDGWCIDVVSYDIYYPKNSGRYLRRRAESPVLGNLLAEIEAQSDGNDEAGDEKT